MAARQRKTVARRVGLDKVQSERVVSSTGQCDFHFQLCHLTCLALRKTMSPGGHKHSPQPNHNGTCAGQSKASGQHPGSWLGSRIPGTDYPSKHGGGGGGSSKRWLHNASQPLNACICDASAPLFDKLTRCKCISGDSAVGSA